MIKLHIMSSINYAIVYIYTMKIRNAYFYLIIPGCNHLGGYKNDISDISDLLSIS